MERVRDQSIGPSNQITAFTTIGFVGLSMCSQAASALGSWWLVIAAPYARGRAAPSVVPPFPKP